MQVKTHNSAIFTYIPLTLHFTLLSVSNPQHSDKAMTLDTSNYNENLQIFLKLAETDTWTRIHIGHRYLSPSNIVFHNRSFFSLLNREEDREQLLSNTVLHSSYGHVSEQTKS